MSDSCVLDVGTEVSAKYRGAFCEAKIKHVKKLIKIRVSWNKPLTGSATLTQDNIRGVVKVGSGVEGKKDNAWVPATVLKVTDASTYTVVFDDGDERTLGRNCVCPQGDKHFKEEMTLDHLPLNNPEIFGTPVILENKKQRKRRKVDGPDSGRSLHYSEEDVGKVAFYDTRSKKQTLVPVLIASHSQCDGSISTNPGEVIVRSFKSGKFMAIPKEDMLRFDRDTEPLQSILNNTSHIVVMKPALEKALAFYDTGVLPISWEVDTNSQVRLKEPDNLNNSKMKKQFNSQLLDFWEKKGNPIIRQPSVGYHDLDLFQLYCYVAECGGPDVVTQSMKWRSICAQMNILNLPPSGSHTVKNAYCKYVVPFLPEWEREGKSNKRRSSVSEAPEGESAKKRGRVSTPLSFTKGRRTPTPCSSKGRRNSVKGEDESGNSDYTDYEQMPPVHKYNIGQRVKVLYGAPKACGSYEAKINEKNVDSRTDLPIYYIHYAGWNIRYDEWITEDTIVSLVTRSSKKKGTLLDPPKDVKNVPNRRKIVPKYKKYKKQQSASETSSDDKNSLPASEECSEPELDKQIDQAEETDKKESDDEDERPKEEREGVEETENTAQKTEIKAEPPEPATFSPQKQQTEQEQVEVKVEKSVVAGDVTSSQPTEKFLTCEESFDDDMVDTAVSSTQMSLPDMLQHSLQPKQHQQQLHQQQHQQQLHQQQQQQLQQHVVVRDPAMTSRANNNTTMTSSRHSDVTMTSSRHSDVMSVQGGEEDKAKKEAAAILMTFPSTFAMKGPITGSLTSAHTSHVVPQHLQLAYQYPNVSSAMIGRIQAVSPSKETVLITSSAGVPTQYLSTTTPRQTAMPAAGIGKLSSSPGNNNNNNNNNSPTAHVHYTSQQQLATPHYAQLPHHHHHQGGYSGAKPPGRILTKSGSLLVVSDALQNNITSMLKIEDKKKNRKRKIQQADSTSDIGSRLQQFDFRPDPCEDCDKRPDERPRRAERDKARRGTVKNSEGSKIPGSGDRAVQQPPYWLPGASGVRGASFPVYYTDLIQNGFYVPMRPPGMGPYPPGYTPKFPVPIPKANPDNKDSKPTDSQNNEEIPSSSNITESTLAEPDSTVSDDKPAVTTTVTKIERVALSPHNSSSYKTPPYCTPPYTSSADRLKSTPNLDSDSSDEKNTVPGMSPMILCNSTSECSDKEGSTFKVKIFDNDFGIHVFDHLELPERIRSMQSVMAELQKCYLYYKSQLAAIEKKEREKRRSKKRRKSKQRTTSVSKSSEKPSEGKGQEKANPKEKAAS